MDRTKLTNAEFRDNHAVDLFEKEQTYLPRFLGLAVFNL